MVLNMGSYEEHVGREEGSVVLLDPVVLELNRLQNLVAGCCSSFCVRRSVELICTYGSVLFILYIYIYIYIWVSLMFVE